MTVKNAGFPQDDEYSLQQGCGGNANLDIFYAHQFVQNETLKAINADLGTVHHYHFAKTPILAGTTTAIVYVGDTAVQTFCVSSSGKFTFTNIGEPLTYATEGSLNLETGELELRMSHYPSELVSVVASYEYDHHIEQQTPNEFDYTDEIVENMQVDGLEDFQSGLMEMFFTSKNPDHRKILLAAISALDDVVFKVVKGAR